MIRDMVMLLRGVTPSRENTFRLKVALVLLDEPASMPTRSRSPRRAMVAKPKGLPKATRRAVPPKPPKPELAIGAAPPVKLDIGSAPPLAIGAAPPVMLDIGPTPPTSRPPPHVLMGVEKPPDPVVLRTPPTPPSPPSSFTDGTTAQTVQLYRPSATPGRWEEVPPNTEGISELEVMKAREVRLRGKKCRDASRRAPAFGSACADGEWTQFLDGDALPSRFLPVDQEEPPVEQEEEQDERFPRPSSATPSSWCPRPSSVTNRRFHRALPTTVEDLEPPEEQDKDLEPPVKQDERHEERVERHRRFPSTPPEEQDDDLEPPVEQDESHRARVERHLVAARHRALRRAEIERRVKREAYILTLPREPPRPHLGP